jgi:hypothetical protein
MGGLEGDQCLDEQLEALDGDQPADGHHQGRVGALAVGRELGLDTGGRHRDPFGRDPEAFHDLLSGR